MPKPPQNTRCLEGLLRSMKHRQSETDFNRLNVPTVNGKRLRGVCIVEFRDEVFAGLRPLFESCGVRVDRAESAGDVQSRVSRLKPDLLLISGNMPDESGWIICAKLRIRQRTPPAWIYLPQAPHLPAQWLEVSGADEVIVYGGVLPRLVDEIRQRVDQQPQPATNPERQRYELAVA